MLPHQRRSGTAGSEKKKRFTIDLAAGKAAPISCYRTHRDSEPARSHRPAPEELKASWPASAPAHRRAVRARMIYLETTRAATASGMVLLIRNS